MRPLTPSDGTWQKAVNMMNPLGTKGKFTEAYARLLVDMWQADTGALVPYPFRVRTRMWSGWGQLTQVQ